MTVDARAMSAPQRAQARTSMTVSRGHSFTHPTRSVWDNVRRAGCARHASLAVA